MIVKRTNVVSAVGAAARAIGLGDNRAQERLCALRAKVPDIGPDAARLRRACKDAVARSPVSPPPQLTRVLLRAYERWLLWRASPDTSLVCAGPPLPPPDLRVLTSSNADPDFFLESGRLETKLIADAVARHGRPIGGMDAILDFGCGCGRLARWWWELDRPRVHGCDYNPRLVAWCTEQLDHVDVALNELDPPLRYAEQTFDLIYALSVFTHLPPSLAQRWMAELERVLKPGGLIFFSTHGEAYLDRLSPGNRAAFGRGEAVTQFGEVAGTNLCSTFFPPGYVGAQLLDGLELLELIPGRHGGGGEYRLPHDAYVVRRP